MNFRIKASDYHLQMPIQFGLQAISTSPFGKIFFLQQVRVFIIEIPNHYGKLKQIYVRKVIHILNTKFIGK